MARSYYYWDKVERKLKEGFPPNPNIRYGDAPYIITDTIDPYYHPAAGKYVESKKELDCLDKACGTITTDKKLEPIAPNQKEKEAKADKDRLEALKEAKTRLENGTAPITEEKRARLKEHDKMIKHAWNNGQITETGIIRADLPNGK